MKLNTVLWIGGALLLSGTSGQAAITCSISPSPGFTITGYVEGAPSAIDTNFQVNCTRGTTADPSTFDYTVAFGPGNNHSGGNRASATVGGTVYYIRYGIAASAGTCGTPVGSLSGSFSWPTSGQQALRTGTKSNIHNYAGCVSGGQSGMAAGTYQDSIGLTLTTASNVATAFGTASVTIGMPGACSLTQAPGNVNFAYAAFSNVAVTASTGFKSRCTNSHPYTMAISPASGTVQGLSYSLDVLTSSNVVVDPAAVINGTGADQTYTIRGRMAAGQAGTCSASSCTSAAVPHTLTISY